MANRKMVYMARKVGEDDYKPFGDPLPYDEAVATLSQLPTEHLDHLDLIYVRTGRLASWVIEG